jgi:hypothetical protein
MIAARTTAASAPTNSVYTRMPPMAIQTARRLPTTLVPTNISRPPIMAILEPVTQIDVCAGVYAA